MSVRGTKSGSSLSDADQLREALERAETLLEDRPSDALVIARDASALAERLGDEHGMAAGLYLTGMVHYLLDDCDSALDYLERARSTFETLGSPRDLARAIEAIGVVKGQRNEHDEALDRLGEALSLAEASRDIEGLSRVLGRIGGTLGNMGKYEAAVDHYRRALSIAEEHGFRSLIAVNSNGLGIVYKTRGEYLAALPCYQRAIELATELGNEAKLVRYLGNLANVYTGIGEYARAAQHYEAAITLAAARGDRMLVANNTGGIAVLNCHLGNYETALDRFRFACSIFEELGDLRGMAETYGNMACLYSDMGQPDEALPLFENALVISERIGYRKYAALTIGNAATIHAERGEYVRALDGFNDALRLSTELGDLVGVLNFTASAAHVYARPEFGGYDPARAEQMLKGCCELAAEDGDRHFLAKLHLWLADLFEHERKFEAACEHLSRHYELKVTIESHAAHRQAQQLENRRQIAELERQHALETAAAREAALRAELLASRIEIKQRELASATMSVARQAETLRHFRESMLDIVKNSTDARTAVARVRERIRELPREGLAWPEFEKEFRRNYPEFGTRLIEKYPALTKTEVRVCSLLKLRLTTPVIARLLSLSERSVEWHRANVRKKVGIESKADLRLALDAVQG